MQWSDEWFRSGKREGEREGMGEGRRFLGFLPKLDLIGFKIELKVDCKRNWRFILMIHSIFNEIWKEIMLRVRSSEFVLESEVCLFHDLHFLFCLCVRFAANNWNKTVLLHRMHGVVVLCCHRSRYFVLICVNFTICKTIICAAYKVNDSFQLFMCTLNGRKRSDKCRREKWNECRDEKVTNIVVSHSNQHKYDSISMKWQCGRMCASVYLKRTYASAYAHRKSETQRKGDNFESSDVSGCVWLIYHQSHVTIDSIAFDNIAMSSIYIKLNNNNNKHRGWHKIDTWKNWELIIVN